MIKEKKSNNCNQSHHMVLSQQHYDLPHIDHY